MVFPLPRTPARVCDRSADLQLQSRPQVRLQRRENVFVGAGAQRSQDLLRLGAGVQHDHHRAARGRFDAAHHGFERTGQPADIDENHIGMQCLDGRSQRLAILLIEHDAHGQIAKTILDLLPKLPG